MINIFIDETSDSKYKDYLGICCTSLNHCFYTQIKKEAQKILREGNWSFDIEFKGAYLFSASKGCIEVDIEKRIELAEKILDLATASKNTRLKIAYFHKESINHKKDYLDYVPLLIYKSLGYYSISPKMGKNLVNINCDYRDDISVLELRNVILPVIKKRKCVLFEDISQVSSNCETIGILFSDIIGYLMSRIETISRDIELFNGLTTEQIEKNGRLKKLKSSWELIDRIKKMTIYELK